MMAEKKKNSRGLTILLLKDHIQNVEKKSKIAKIVSVCILNGVLQCRILCVLWY